MNITTYRGLKVVYIKSGVDIEWRALRGSQVVHSAPSAMELGDLIDAELDGPKAPAAGASSKDETRSAGEMVATAMRIAGFDTYRGFQLKFHEGAWHAMGAGNAPISAETHTALFAKVDSMIAAAEAVASGAPKLKR